METYAYYRVSTQTQAEKNGIEMQLAEIEKYCSMNGIELSGSFSDEGITGTTEKREGLIDCMASLEKGDRIVVQNTSRLWRDEAVKVFVIRELRKIGADIISIEQPKYTIYETDPANKFFNAIMEALDSYDRDLISMKLAKGRKARAKSGNKPCGMAPIGYRWEGNKIVVDYNNQLIVQEIFKIFLEARNLSKTQRECKKRGYKTTRGKDFSVQAIKNILQNDFYIGMVTYAGKKIEGEHNPIVNREIFERVQNIMEGNGE